MLRSEIIGEIVESRDNDNSKPESDAESKSQRHRTHRHRTSFSDEQVKKLEVCYEANPYLGLKEREALAQKLNVEERSVNNWFKNRRVRAKRNSGEQLTGPKVG